MTSAVAAQIGSLLKIIYAEFDETQISTVVGQILRLIGEYSDGNVTTKNGRWSERDMALIAYGDQVQDRTDDAATLGTLKQFVLHYDLHKLFSIVHILPFCPYSSDDGFSVIDFREIDSQLGTWDDIQDLSHHVDLMFDLVLNHVSARSEWFQSFLAGAPQYANWFHDIDPSNDLSKVTRPRSHPLLTRFASSDGDRFIWTTFSEDQIDLNYSNPAVLLEMLDILLLYVTQGARIVRLDAIAFLWKELGTTCLHLPQTHAVVKLYRAVLDAVAPEALLLTETNVPHPENISYFGDGDEAHMVYNFSLPPLLFDAYLNREPTPLRSWLRELMPPPEGTTWFNFTASHDGIGLRPLEGLIDDERFERLLHGTRERGGEISMREMPDESLKPYELNITWCAAMRDPETAEDPYFVTRVLASQAFMLAVQGVPATYFHSLVGSPNDVEGMTKSGHSRRINRQKYDYETLINILDSHSDQAAIFHGYRDLLAIRRCQKAFHPNSRMEVIHLDSNSVVAFRRIDPHQEILVAANFDDKTERIYTNRSIVSELITGQACDGQEFELRPFQVAWLELN